MDRVLNHHHPSSDEASDRHRYHVGYMKVPIVLDESESENEGGGGAGQQGTQSRGTFVRRDNIVLFIVKNPTIPHMSSDILKNNFEKYLSLSEEQSRPRSSIPLPFANDTLEPFISKWIDMYENVDSLK
jgi:hypothetical protein